MFTYKIQHLKAQRNALEGSTSFHNKEESLKRNLDKCWFVTGDRVKFKKQKKGIIYATIVEVIDDPDKVTWSHGGMCPMNIVIDVEKKDKGSNVVYGVERVKTNVKKLAFVSSGRNK